MSKCSKCGSDLQKGAIICRVCGQRFIDVNPVEDETDGKQKAGRTHTQNVKSSNVRETSKQQSVKSHVQPERVMNDDVQSQKKLVGDNTVLSTGSYLLMYFIQMIPCLNIIMLLIWAFGKSGNVNKRNYARAQLILVAVVTIMLILLYIVLGATLVSMFSGMM